MNEFTFRERRFAVIALTIIIFIYTFRGLENLIFIEGVSDQLKVSLDALSILAYFLFFPVIAIVPAKSWAKIAGYIWLILDMTATTMPLYNVPIEIYSALRFGGAHMATAVWIGAVSMGQKGALAIVGLPMAVFLAAYSFIKLWVPPFILDYFFIVLILWYVLLLRYLVQKRV
jgi:hypothetical protein